MLNGVVGFKMENYMSNSRIFDESVDKILNAGEERLQEKIKELALIDYRRQALSTLFYKMSVFNH